MKQRLHTFTLLAAIVSIFGSAALAVSLIALLWYGLPEARALSIVGVAYVAAGLSCFRFRPGPWLPAWVIPAGLGLAALELTNICLEQFIGLPSPANAVVPASMMALMVLSASAAAVVASAGSTLFRGTISAVIVLGLGILLSVSVVLVFVTLRAASQPNMVPLLALTCENATMHLTLPLLVAAVAGSAAAAISGATSGYQLRASVFISVGGIPLLVTGISLLVRAASLARAERPPLVMPGVALAALGLVLLPCILGRGATTSTA